MRRTGASTARRLTLLDAIAIVGAVGLALGGLRYWYSIWRRPWNELGPVELSLAAGTYSCLALAFVLPLLRAIPPRMRWRRVRRQPGFVAGGAILLAFGLHTVRHSPGFIDFRGRVIGRSALNWASLLMFPQTFAPAVIVAWSVLLLSGRWTRPADPIDALGCVAGGGMIALFLVSEAKSWPM